MKQAEIQRKLESENKGRKLYTVEDIPKGTRVKFVMGDYEDNKKLKIGDLGITLNTHCMPTVHWFRIKKNEIQFAHQLEVMK